MYFTDHPEQFRPNEAEHLDALQAIWESEENESTRRAEIYQILHPQGLALHTSAETAEKICRVA